MQVKFTREHEDIPIPTYSNKGDAGLDLIAWNTIKDDVNCIWYDTGICVEIPIGYVGLIFPRSSISKYPLSLANSVGIIDSGYRGRIQVRFNRINAVREKERYYVGDKIAQIVIIPIPYISFIEVEELSDSERGESGFGSSGI